MADNPVLRELIGTQIKSELSSHHSEATAWHSKGEQDKKAGFLEYTIESETWVWLDKPAENLHISVTKFDLNDGNLGFTLEAKAKVRAKLWGKIPRFGKGDVTVKAKATISITGATTIADGRLKNTEITDVSGKLRDLDFNNDVLKQMRGLIESTANRYIKDSEDDLRKDLAKAIDGTKF